MVRDGDQRGDDERREGFGSSLISSQGREKASAGELKGKCEREAAGVRIGGHVAYVAGEVQGTLNIIQRSGPCRAAHAALTALQGLSLQES
jgi:hypothetical protein